MWREEAEVEEVPENIKDPFRFPRFNIDDVAGFDVVRGVCGEISENSYGVEILREVLW